MKKVNAILAALTLAVTALTPLASSASESTLKEGNNTMTLSKTYSDGYTLNIPDAVQNLDETSKLTVSATGFLNVDQKIIVSVESKNQWYLQDETCDTNKIKYNVSVNGNTITTQEADIFEITYDDESHTKEVTINVDGVDEPTYAGTYTDTLTFSARVETIVNEEKKEEVTTSETEEQETTLSSSDGEENETQDTVTTPVDDNTNTSNNTQ